MSKFGVFLYEGFQEMEFWYPVLRLREIGADVAVIGVAGGGAAPSALGYPVIPNLALADARPEDFTALIVPGGRIGALKDNGALRDFLSQAAARGARVLAISQAAALAPGALVARTTDDVPQCMRKLIEELAR